MKTKKIVSLILAALMMLSLSSMFVMAESGNAYPMEITHITASTPSMDGNIKEDEYGDPILQFKQKNVEQTSGVTLGTKNTSNTEQQVSIYMTCDETHFYVAATLDNATAGTEALCTITLSKYDDQEKSFHTESGCEKFFIARLKSNDANSSSFADFFRISTAPSAGAVPGSADRTGAPAGNQCTGKGYWDSTSNTYTYEMRIEWQYVPGMTVTEAKNGTPIAATMRICDGGSKGNDYRIGGDAALNFSSEANAHADGVLKITPGEWCKVSNSVAKWPGSAPKLEDAIINPDEYGEPIVVTSPTNAKIGKYSLWYVDKFTDDDDASTNVNNAQRVKVYMTNDEEFLYVAATMDHAVGKFPTGGYEKPMLIFTAAAYTGDTTNPVPQLNEGNDNYHVFRLQFNSADAVAKLSRIRNGTENSQNLDSTAQGSANYDENTNTFTYELKIAWENIPGMEDGIFNGKQLAYSMAIRDGNADLTGSKTNTNYRIGGAGALNGLSGAAPHAGTDMMKMTINAVDGDTHAKAKVTAGGTTTYYGAIDRAVTATNNGTAETITLLNEDTATANVMVESVDTLDLKGNTLNAASVTSFGDIKDSSGGEGIIKVKQNIKETEESAAETYLVLQSGNTTLPLYDKVDGGYRFFTFDLVNKGQKQGTTEYPGDTNVMRYGVHLSFDSIKAYELMAAGALDVDLYMNLTTEEKVLGDDGIDYYFNPEKYDTLKDYGAECVKDFDDKTALEKNTIVLIVTGMAALKEDLKVTARLETTTIVIPSEAVVNE